MHLSQQVLRRHARSIFGLPLISPVKPWYRLWSTVIVLLDSTYTAFLVPILVGFQVSDVSWTWGAYIDLIAGACLTFVSRPFRDQTRGYPAGQHLHCLPGAHLVGFQVLDVSWTWGAYIDLSAGAYCTYTVSHSETRHISMLLDSTYTGFLVPFLVGFQVSDDSWTRGAYIELIGGARLAHMCLSCWDPALIA